jgi:hypothetical protein
LKSHVFREGGIRLGVWKIIRAVKDTMRDIKSPAFPAAVVFFEKLVFVWEEFWATKAFGGSLSVGTSVAATNLRRL